MYITIHKFIIFSDKFDKPQFYLFIFLDLHSTCFTDAVYSAPNPTFHCLFNVT